MSEKSEIKPGDLVEFDPNTDVITAPDEPYGRIILMKVGASKFIVLDNVRSRTFRWNALRFYIHHGHTPVIRVKKIGRQYIHAIVENVEEIEQFYRDHGDENRKFL